MRYRILKELVYSLEYNKEWQKGILLGILGQYGSRILAYQ